MDRRRDVGGAKLILSCHLCANSRIAGNTSLTFCVLFRDTTPADATAASVNHNPTGRTLMSTSFSNAHCSLAAVRVIRAPLAVRLTVFPQSR